MSLDIAFQGSLFASDFLRDAITRSPDWQELDDASLEELEAALRAIFDRFPAAASPNESQTENDLIWPVLAAARGRLGRLGGAPSRSRARRAERRACDPFQGRAA